MITVDLDDYERFHVTGKKVNGSRFKLVYNADRPGFHTAFGINLWSGSVWGVHSDGTRKLLRRA